MNDGLPGTPEERNNWMREWEAQIENRKKGLVTAYTVAGMAGNLNHWIFDPDERKWYTPEEFTRTYRHLQNNHPYFKKVQIKDPIATYNEGKIKVMDFLMRLFDLSVKIIRQHQTRPPRGSNP